MATKKEICEANPKYVKVVEGSYDWSELKLVDLNELFEVNKLDTFPDNFLYTMTIEIKLPDRYDYRFKWLHDHNVILISNQEDGFQSPTSTCNHKYILMLNNFCCEYCGKSQ